MTGPSVLGMVMKWSLGGAIVGEPTCIAAEVEVVDAVVVDASSSMETSGGSFCGPAIHSLSAWKGKKTMITLTLRTTTCGLRDTRSQTKATI